MGFGLSNNVPPFCPTCHKLSPSYHSQHLKISFYFFSPSFPGLSPSFRPFQLLTEILFWASYPPPFTPGGPANLPFAPLSILLYFLLHSSTILPSTLYLAVSVYKQQKGTWCHPLQRFNTPYSVLALNLLCFPYDLPTKRGLFTETTLIACTASGRPG